MSRAVEKNRRDEEELRIAHGAVGEETRKQKNLEMEWKRYKDAMESDRRVIEKITEELKLIDTNDKEQKVQFVKEMESLNNENEFILTNRENKKMSQLLNADNVQWFVKIELMDAGRDGDKMHEGIQWNDVVARAQDEAATLIEIEGKRDALLKQTAELETILKQLRTKFMYTHNNQGQIDIHNLEAKWMQQPSGASADDCDASEEEESEITMHNNGRKALNCSHGVPSPIHMELFYNEQ